MTDPATPPPRYDRIETPTGVIYRFRLSYRPSLILVKSALLLAAIPLALAVTAVVFLFRHADEIEGLLLALSALFVGQMGLIAFIPLQLLFGRKFFWSALAARYGHHELELNGPLLYLGARLGRIRGKAIPVADLQRFIVYAYYESDGLEESGEAVRKPSGCLAVVEAPGRGPYPYVVGWPWPELRALAEDLQRRLPEPRPPVEVVETTEDAAMELANPPSPDAESARPWWARSRWFWLAWHGAGLVGLVALGRAATGRLPPWVMALGVLVMFADMLMLLAGLRRKWPPGDLGGGTKSPGGEP